MAIVEIVVVGRKTPDLMIENIQQEVIGRWESHQKDRADNVPMRAFFEKQGFKLEVGVCVCVCVYVCVYVCVCVCMHY